MHNGRVLSGVCGGVFVLSRVCGGVVVLSRECGGAFVLSRECGGVFVLSRECGGVFVLSRASMWWSVCGECTLASFVSSLLVVCTCTFTERTGNR